MRVSNNLGSYCVGEREEEEDDSDALLESASILGTLASSFIGSELDEEEVAAAKLSTFMSESALEDE